jgi:hypothetical protein
MRLLYLGVLLFGSSTVFGSAASAPAPSTTQPVTSGASSARAVERAWIESLPTAPPLELKHLGLVAKEIRRWKVRGAGQGVAVDDNFFYGIGNFIVGKYDKRTGERVAEWIGLRGGPITHFNYGFVEGGTLTLSHSNFPQLPMASSIEYFDTATLQPTKTHSLGIQHGSLTWATRKDGFWWACFANYNDRGTTPGLDNRWTFFGKFTDDWQLVESWIFPPQLIKAFNPSSCSGGSWGDDGELYVTGHDARELYVLRLPKMGPTLELVTVIEVPFDGQAWAWDRKEKRVIYGITRASGEVVVAQVPELPAELRSH